ncbi:Flp pilus assembly protein CpaB [Neobacillus drentensis]|uniref:Flp pilus assembly protein CpaB n=1 Tax=Neobacillus drentensis TaxID=220684 RepID=UPI003000B35D
MNTKKIWIISLILGVAVAGIAYLTVFSKGKASSASGVVVTQEKEEKKAGDEQAKKEKELEREIKNPLVEVSKGKRAISVKVNLEQGVSGYVAQNSMVDVIAYETTKDDKKDKEYKSAVLVLENVKVLTSGKAADNKEEALHYETVTLEVTPEEGVMLGLASQDKNGFYLMLRNTTDTQTGKAGLKQTREVIKEGASDTK